MVYVQTPVEFIDQSLQLLQARPSTTRVTTVYNVCTKSKIKRKSKSQTDTTADTTTTSSTATPPTPKGKITLKTYDPVSGAVIKFKTHKAADVGRLVAALSRMARGMAGLPDQAPDVEMTQAPAIVEQGSGTATPQQQEPQQAKSTGKKKKKGKK